MWPGGNCPALTHLGPSEGNLKEVFLKPNRLDYPSQCPRSRKRRSQTDWGQDFSNTPLIFSPKHNNILDDDGPCQLMLRGNIRWKNNIRECYIGLWICFWRSIQNQRISSTARLWVGAGPQWWELWDLSPGRHHWGALCASPLKMWGLRRDDLIDPPWMNQP